VRPATNDGILAAEDPMSQPVTRHFATLPGGRFGPRQVHYRRAGRGPCVILLHQSPMSSRDVLPMMGRLSDRFTCIAPDTPGYGLSDPFGPPEVTMEAVAEAVVEFADALGIGRFAVYGFHTGAMIGVAVGHQYPERVTGVAANGFVVPTDAMRAELLEHYLPAFEPQWDGSHLAWLWARLREQTIFFPWYRKDLASRMDFDLPSPEALQNSVVEFLRAGDQYRVAYRAAFAFRGDAALAATRTPTLVTATAADPLHADLARIVDPSPAVEVAAGGSLDETLGLCADFLARHPAAQPPPPPATAPLAGRTWQQMVDVPGGQLRVRRNTDSGGRVVLVQHDAASSSDQVEPVARSLIGHRPVLAIDLPGHGESDNTIGEEDVTVARYVTVLRQALDALGIDECDFHGMWGGGLVGLELALQDARVHRLVMSDVPWFDAALREELKAHYTPAIEPVWYGGHLLQAWHLLRDQGLFWPWFRRNRDGILWKEPYVDPGMVHARLVSLFKAPRMWRLAYQAHFAYPVEDRLAKVKQPTLLCAPAWDPQLEATRAAQAANPRCAFLELPDSMTDWGPALLPFLDARA
jgi:pimeloyl-ACP methyl ester carboxylesterase